MSPPAVVSSVIRPCPLIVESEIFSEIFSLKSCHVHGVTYSNHNKLLTDYQDCIGGKTGYTKAAGRILVSSAERQGRRLVCVTISDPDDWNDHKALLEKGFSDYSLISVAEEGQVIGTVEVAGGQKNAVQLIAADSFYYAVAADERITVKLPQAEFVYAPVVKGANAGYANVLLDGKCIGKIELLYGQTVEMKAEEKIPFYKRLWKGGAQ